MSKRKIKVPEEMVDVARERSDRSNRGLSLRTIEEILESAMDLLKEKVKRCVSKIRLTGKPVATIPWMKF
jgi:hypothetical protein